MGNVKFTSQLYYYKFIRQLNTRLLFTDTDSLCYELHEKKSIQKNCLNTKNYLI